MKFGDYNSLFRKWLSCLDSQLHYIKFSDSFHTYYVITSYKGERFTKKKFTHRRGSFVSEMYFLIFWSLNDLSNCRSFEFVICSVPYSFI